MDPLTEVLTNIRSSGALIGKSLITPPWSIRYDPGRSLTVATMLGGDGWILREGAEPIRLAVRDLAVLTAPGPFLVTSDPSGRTPPDYLVGADGACVDLAGAALPAQSVGLGGRVTDDRTESDHVLLTGSFPTSGRLAERLLSPLPPVLVVPREQQRSRALEFLEAELGSQEPGQQAVLDRLLDLVLIGALRDWFALPEASVPAWYGAAGDSVVGPALRALHADPARPWTVESLACEAQVSRATFARRFAEVMGEPPISYLAGWRLCLAADLLQDTEDTLATISRKVGYSSAFAFSAAFTREYDLRPSRYRALATTGAG